ncbi:hypothetical protein IQ265_16520 [Nodosilinea sp. LEGE 06152]|uniref:hypothetical protein n=1 Tax=Nodosilinea sp. LEGE 06152 TaxID=2777966 RepID=UPI001882E586|nr:hypothetical protein [Nodosilinea sp. LEGE 06152]MBE9158423.1 hypothetical protein [Nodosilinea sp. LEGE 06152]
MKRKSKPLITGGLLGLAGLGLLPQGAEANTSLPVAVLSPSLGVTLAEDPHSVVVPEPSAQTTAPQTENQGVAQPTWTPEGDSSLAAAVELAPVPSAQPEPTVLDTAVSNRSTKADLAVPEATAALPTPASVVASPSSEISGHGLAEQSTDAAPVPLSAIDSPEPADAVSQSEISQSAHQSALQAESEAIASPAVTAAAAPLEPSAPESPATSVPAAEPFAAIASKPAAKPLAQAIQRPDTALAAPNRPTNLASLQSRAATVQALLHDLRSAYGIEEPLTATDSTAAPAASPRQVSRPETLSRGPQLPTLPSRSARRRLSVQPQKPIAARVAPVVNAPQLPPLPGQTPNVALALPTPQPVMSSGRAVNLSPEPVDVPSGSSAELAVVPRPAAQPSAVTVAQATPSTPAADQLRNDLRIEPLTTAANPAQSFPPSPNAGIPSAFGADWGDVFFSASLSGADRLRAEADGSFSMGFGLGDAQRAVGVELAYNLQSIRRFGENGSFDAKVHRHIYSSDDTQVAAAVGVNNFASYGSDAAGTSTSVYGVVTAARLLQPENPGNRLPITATLGAGSGYFSGENSSVGVIAGVGLQVHPQFSINTAWSGAGLNVGASIVPEPTIPLTLNLLYGDIGNNTRAGSVAVLSIGYGFNFGPRF